MNSINKYQILSEKVTGYNEQVLNEQFFKRLGQGISSLGRTFRQDLQPGYAKQGGARSFELEAELPEMKALQAGLKTVSQKEKTLKGMKIGDIDALDGAIDQYVTSLIDLYQEFKDIVNNPEKREQLPNIMPQVEKAFKDARNMLQQLNTAIADASQKISGAIKGSELAKRTLTVPKPRAGVPLQPGVSNVSAPRTDIPARARGKLTTGGPTPLPLRENNLSLKNVVKL